MTTVACVLRSGGAYSPIWVQRLAAGVRRNSPPCTRFVCLSDVNVPGVETIPLQYDWPRWWPKIEAFRLPGRVMLLDLDKVVVGPLDDMLSWTGERAILRDFHRAGMIGSAVVLWEADGMRSVWDAFIRDPWKEINTERPLGRMDYFIRDHIGPHEFVQDLFPGQVVSYKIHIGRRPVVKPPRNARIVCFYARPKLDSLESTHWLRKEWEAA
jgi:hypothetical protein